MGQIEYRAGQRVRILDTPALHEWNRYREVIGKEFILDELDAKHLNTPGWSAHFEKNKYQINFHHGMFELIEEQWDK
jgi:hypothetical protein